MVIQVWFTIPAAQIMVQRDPLTGSFGTVRVDYATLNPWESYPYLPGAATRASASDFFNISGSLVFEPGEMIKSFNVSIREDLEPEIDETIFARLTGVYLLQGSDTLSEFCVGSVGVRNDLFQSSSLEFLQSRTHQTSHQKLKLTPRSSSTRMMTLMACFNSQPRRLRYPRTSMGCW